MNCLFFWVNKLKSTHKRKIPRRQRRQRIFWLLGKDLNQRPSGYHFVPFAVPNICLRRINLLAICRPLHFVLLALSATGGARNLTQRATLVGLKPLCSAIIKINAQKKNPPTPKASKDFLVAGEGFEPTTFGL